VRPAFRNTGAPLAGWKMIWPVVVSVADPRSPGTARMSVRVSVCV
jgi:hypothetical protein